MIRARIACSVFLLLSVIAPAAAADWPMGRPWGGGGAVPSPYYLVDQGPELSGPGIMIVEIGVTPSDRHMAYPFIGTSANVARFAASSDYYTVYPTTIPGRVTGLPAARRRMPVKARAAH